LKHEVAFHARWLASATSVPEYRQLLGLLRDSTAVSGGHKRSKLRVLAVKAFLRACERAGVEPGCGLEELEGVLAAAPLNDFGLFDEEGQLGGKANFPTAAMANHSCVPTLAGRQEGRNMCYYALRDLSSGEEASFCYLSLDEEEGARKIHQTWGFTCKCQRCETGEAAEFDAAHRCECGGVVLMKDPSGYCVCNSQNNTLNMDRSTCTSGE